MSVPKTIDRAVLNEHIRTASRDTETADRIVAAVEPLDVIVVGDYHDDLGHRCPLNAASDGKLFDPTLRFNTRTFDNLMGYTADLDAQGPHLVRVV